jgi:TonB-linked SusC/RagA family outer membrane protein
VGYATQEIPVSGNVRVVLVTDTELLEELVVTGYGVTTKRSFTGAATTISSEKIANKFEANPINALQGNVPGVQMSIGSGQPGAPTTVFIRGRNSLNSGTQPLYVVDGVAIESGNVGMRESEGQTLTPLSTLNSEDIESVTVLKDATATSIYGARAANGVIVITTKRGKAGLSVNFTAKMGREMLPNIPKSYRMVDSEKYYEMSIEAALNGHNYGQTVGGVGYFDLYNDAYELGLPYTTEGARDFLGWYSELDVSPDNKANTDWLKEVTRNGFIQNYTLDLQGGGVTETAPKYYMSLDYMGNDAIIRGKDLKRYSMRFNFDQAPSKIVKFGFNTNLSYTITNMGAGGGYFSDPITQAYMQAPNSPVHNEDGSYNFGTINGYNPVAQRSDLGDKSTAKQYRALFSPYLQINFTDNLFFLTRNSVDAYILDEFGYWSFMQPQGKDMRGMGENGYTANILLTSTNTLNYIKTFNDVHSLNLLVGQEGQQTNLKKTYLDASNYAVDYLNEVTLASVPGSASTERMDLKLLSFFSRGEYSYDNKYYLSGSLRYDASSRFGKNNRWAPFASVGAKYRLSAESFMESASDWLSDLTIRSSYGTSGNQQVGNADIANGWYAARDLYAFGYNYNNLPGSGHVQFGNDDLKWEQTAKFNVGLDFTLFNRFVLSADIYDHKTKDMVFAVPVSRTTGLSSYYRNIGELSNKGFEITLDAAIIRNKDLQWNVSLNGGKNINKIIKLSTDNPIEGTYTIIEPGRDIYTFKMKEWAGVDPETGRGTWYKNEEGDEKTFSYGEAKKRYLGKASPDFQGGLNSTVRYKGFDFAFQLNYSIGGKIYGNNLRYDEQYGNSYGNNFSSYVYDNRWKKPGDIAKVPMLYFGTQATWHSHSSRFLMDASYLKLRSVSLGYTLPQSVIKNIGMKNLRLFVNADNLYTFSAKDYRGFDPSGIGANGVQWWNYPVPRNVLFGATIGF